MNQQWVGEFSRISASEGARAFQEPHRALIFGNASTNRQSIDEISEPFSGRPQHGAALVESTGEVFLRRHVESNFYPGFPSHYRFGSLQEVTSETQTRPNIEIIDFIMNSGPGVSDWRRIRGPRSSGSLVKSPFDPAATHAQQLASNQAFRPHLSLS